MKIVVFLIATLFSANLYAQDKGEGFTFKRFGGGGVTTVFAAKGSYGVGGYGEFAFLFYNKSGLQVANHIIGKGENITIDEVSYGIGSVSDKVSFGGFLSEKLRAYAFVQGGVGFGGGNEKSALNLSFGGGGGLDIFVHKTLSLCLDAGYLQHQLDKKLIGGLAVNLGLRSFF